MAGLLEAPPPVSWGALYPRSVYDWLPPGVDLLTDVSEADWITRRLLPLGEDGGPVGLFMPQGFAAYARILHPAGGRGGAWEGLRWAEVASRLSKPFHPDVAMCELAVDPDNHPMLGDITPREGSLPLRTLESLVTLLGRWTEKHVLDEWRPRQRRTAVRRGGRTDAGTVVDG